MNVAPDAPSSPYGRRVRGYIHEKEIPPGISITLWNEPQRDDFVGMHRESDTLTVHL